MKLASIALAVVSLSAACLLGGTAPVAACTGVQPRMSDVRAAEYIVAGRLTSAAAGGNALIIEVQRTVKGDVPSVIHPTGIVTGVCGDGALGARSNTRVIFARHFAFFAKPVDAFWTFDEDGRLLVTSVRQWSGQTYTFDSVLASLQGLPPTDIGDQPAKPSVGPGALLTFLSALLAAWIVGGRRTPR
jgi:hypothetical protein